VKLRNDRRSAEAGFTLLEVLIAMVILSVGLLALEGLTVSSAKVTASASRRSRYVEVATDTLERTMSRLAEGQAVASPTSFYITNNAGANTAQVTVSYTNAGTLSSPSPANTRYDVSVRVIPTVTARMSDSVNLTASVIR